MKPRNDKVKSGITHDEIIQWGGQEVFNQALALCNSGDVSDVKYDDDTLVISGKILQPSGYQMPVFECKVMMADLLKDLKDKNSSFLPDEPSSDISWPFLQLHSSSSFERGPVPS